MISPTGADGSLLRRDGPCCLLLICRGCLTAVEHIVPSLVASARDAQTHQLVPGKFEIPNTDDGTRYTVTNGLRRRPLPPCSSSHAPPLPTGLHERHTRTDVEETLSQMPLPLDVLECLINSERLAVGDCLSLRSASRQLHLRLTGALPLHLQYEVSADDPRTGVCKLSGYV